MSDTGREPAVALALYARPETTERVLAALGSIRPRHLLVFADAAPADSDRTAERVERTRGLLERIDWDCELETDFAEEHLGLRRRIESGLDWVFDRVEEAVVLEDDCVPHPSFFDFSAELLDRYRDEPRVMAISGNSFDPWCDAGTRPDRAPSYRFSRYPLIWGWASWRRAWRSHDREMASWPELRRAGWLGELFDDRHAVEYWTHLFDRTFEGEIDTWDYRFMLSVWRARGLSVEPCVNLVSNVGFGAAATHTREDRSAVAARPVGPISLPLAHPERIERDREADAHTEDLLFSGQLRRMWARVRRRKVTERVQGE